MDVLRDGKVVHKDVPMRNALNEVLRTEYIKDCQRGVDRWNKTIQRRGRRSSSSRLPSHKFHRQIGMWAGQLLRARRRDARRAPRGRRAAASGCRREADEHYVKSLMKPVYEPRQDGELDRAAGEGHQRPARRLRVRATLDR